MKNDNNIKIFSEEEYTDACENYQGLCLNCLEFKDGVEPDAENYECEECGECQVYGLEQALICDYIKIDG